MAHFFTPSISIHRASLSTEPRTRSAMRLAIVLLALIASSLALRCPPQCIGKNRSSIFLSASFDVAFKGRIEDQSSAKRVVGQAGEVDYVITVLEVYKGGIFQKRNGKNVVHVFSGLGLESGSECSVSLTPKETYLFAGMARRGSSPSQTAQIDINQCSLAILWSSVSFEEETFLQRAVAPHFTQQCSRLSSVGPSPQCLCNSAESCFTSVLPSGKYCGQSQAWCVPRLYVE